MQGQIHSELAVELGKITQLILSEFFDTQSSIYPLFVTAPFPVSVGIYPTRPLQKGTGTYALSAVHFVDTSLLLSLFSHASSQHIERWIGIKDEIIDEYACRPGFSYDATLSTQEIATWCRSIIASEPAAVMSLDVERLYVNHDMQSLLAIAEECVGSTMVSKAVEEAVSLIRQMQLQDPAMIHGIHGTYTCLNAGFRAMHLLAFASCFASTGKIVVDARALAEFVPDKLISSRNPSKDYQRLMDLLAEAPLWLMYNDIPKEDRPLAPEVHSMFSSLYSELGAKLFYPPATLTDNSGKIQVLDAELLRLRTALL